VRNHPLTVRHPVDQIQSQVAAASAQTAAMNQKATDQQSAFTGNAISIKFVAEEGPASDCGARFWETVHDETWIQC
jgi:type IV pilus biogenesis protein CpaD/CtpE